MARRENEWGKGSGLAVALVLGTLAIALSLSSCSVTPEPSTAKAPMDLAMDTGGERMYYRGKAFIPRSFNSATPFELDVEMAYWGNPAANDTGAHAHEALGEVHESAGIYQPLRSGQGVISLVDGRLLLRGRVLDDGQELDGEWFFDGKQGGGFRIAREGYLFP
ncbi:MAG: hypothetical protein GWO24_29205 [Akkermansiaceae bacterium]|nr:hypothetical protein [Akkermansiaceae bacterium]